MKKIYFLTLLAVALMVSLSSCSKESKGNNGELGEKSYLTVSLNIPKDAPTRAHTGLDPEAIAGEGDIHNVTVFIFSGDGSGIYQKHETLTADKFDAPVKVGDQDELAMKSNTMIVTTVGPKKIFVGVNLSAKMVTDIAAMTASELGTKAIDVTRAEMTNLTTGLPMLSTAVVYKSVVASADGTLNKFDITVKRPVMKVTAKYNTSTLVTTGVPGTLGALQFAIDNFNLKLLPLEGPAPFKDANWDIAHVAADFSLAVAANYKSILDLDATPAPGKDDYTPGYASENTSEGKAKQDLTRVKVRSTFIPDVQHKYNAATDELTLATTVEIVVKTFWSVRLTANGDTYYLYTKQEADDLAANRTGTVGEYTDGFCYWFVWLNKADVNNKFDVLRNKHVNIEVRSIVAPGNTGDIDDPSIKPDQEANIKVDINVLHWDTVTNVVEDLVP